MASKSAELEKASVHTQIDVPCDTSDLPCEDASEIEWVVDGEVVPFEVAECSDDTWMETLGEHEEGAASSTKADSADAAEDDPEGLCWV